MGRTQLHSELNKKMILGLFIITIALLNIGCGAQKQSASGSSDQSSRESIDTNTGNNTGAKPLAKCNRGVGELVTANLMAYEDVNGSRMDFMRVKISNLTSNFTNTNYAIRFFKWKVNSAGSAFLDSNHLHVRYESRSGYQALGGFHEEISWPMIQYIAQQNNKTVESPQKFFEQYTVLVDLKDYYGEYDVLKVVMYDGENIIMTKDILMPAFFANPATYMYENDGVTPRSSRLTALHPFNNMMNQGWGDNHFVNESLSLCF